MRILEGRFCCLAGCTGLLLLSLSACGGSSGDGALPPGDVDQPANDLIGNGADTPPVDVSGCTESISSGRVTLPTVLTDSANECDYYITGSVQFLSPVTIEPGTTIVMGQSANVSFREGQLTAVGTPEQRITIRGEAPLQGYWAGISLTGMRPSRIEHVDIMDGGNNDNGVSTSQRGALFVSLSTISLIDVSISNSQNYGLNLSSSARLTAFANNRFFGNILEGVLIPTSLVPELDTFTDYLGISSPNERPYINVQLDSDPISATWKALNAPYQISLLQLGSGEKLTLEPGTHLVMPETTLDTSIIAFNNGELILDGTAENPIIIERSPLASGPWQSISVAGGFVRLNHTRISGGTSGVIIERADSDVVISNTLFEDHVN